VKCFLLARSIAFLLVLSLLAGCSNDNIPTATKELIPDVRVTENDNQTVTFDEEIKINNCGNSTEDNQVSTRSYSTNIEGGSQIKVGYAIVEGSVNAKYGQYRTVSKSHTVVAPANTRMIFVLRWTEQTWSGSIILGNDSGNYIVHVPVSVEQMSSKDLGCPPLPGQPETQPPSIKPMTINVSPDPESIPPGGTMTIRVEALSAPNSPIEGVNVRVQVGGGFFTDTNDLEVTGATNPFGFYSAEWNCPPSAPSPSGYYFTITASKDGYTETSQRILYPIR
jgi:hypothetical protein